MARLRGLAEDIEAPPPGRFADHGEESRWLVAANQEFHGMIVTASRNGRLEKLIRRTAEVPLMFKALFWYGPRERAISNHYHRQILKAPETGDGERAEIIVREHVYEGRAFVIGALEEEVR